MSSKLVAPAKAIPALPTASHSHHPVTQANQQSQTPADPTHTHNQSLLWTSTEGFVAACSRHNSHRQKRYNQIGPDRLASRPHHWAPPGMEMTLPPLESLGSSGKVSNSCGSLFHLAWILYSSLHRQWQDTMTACNERVRDPKGKVEHNKKNG